MANGYWNTESREVLTVDYDGWINRERRLRVKTLETSLVIKQKNTYRICTRCSEICLCHEERCPNCDSDQIMESPLVDLKSEGEKRIRCKFRYSNMFGRKGS